MKFYQKYFKNNYEELLTYYPRYYREIFEMVEILKAHGKIADALEENIERVFLNNFILTADEKTIQIWEQDILNITYQKKTYSGTKKKCHYCAVVRTWAYWGTRNSRNHKKLYPKCRCS